MRLEKLTEEERASLRTAIPILMKIAETLTGATQQHQPVP